MLQFMPEKTRFAGLGKRGVPFENAFWGREVHGRWFPSRYRNQVYNYLTEYIQNS